MNFPWLLGQGSGQPQWGLFPAAGIAGGREPMSWELLLILDPWLFHFLLISSVVLFSTHNSNHISNQDAARHETQYFTATPMYNFSFHLPTL